MRKVFDRETGHEYYIDDFGNEMSIEEYEQLETREIDWDSIREDLKLEEE